MNVIFNSSESDSSCVANVFIILFEKLPEIVTESLIVLGLGNKVVGFLNLILPWRNLNFVHDGLLDVEKDFLFSDIA